MESEAMMEDKDDREEIVDAVHEGRAEWHPDAEKAFENGGLNFNDPDQFDLTEVRIEHCWAPHDGRGPNPGNNGGMEVRYITKNAGFGSFTIFADIKGNTICDNEAMDRDFLKKVMCKLIDEAELKS